VKLERVIYRPIVEDQARLTELLTGALDLIVGTPPDYVGQLESSGKVTLLKQVGAHVWYLGINNQKKPFDDKRVRQGPELRRQQGCHRARRAQGHRLAVGRARAAEDVGRRHRPQALSLRSRAREEALAEAGYPSGFTTTLWVPESGSGMQSPVAMSTVIQSNLKAVGVNVALQTMEWGAYLAKLRTKEQELFALSWMAGNEDPDMVMYPLLHSSQWTPERPEPRAVQEREVRRPAAPGAADHRREEARRSLPPGPAHPGRRRAVDLRRPRDPDRPPTPSACRDSSSIRASTCASRPSR
jgi:peptide/nickel transport system substrate-binding protein